MDGSWQTSGMVVAQQKTQKKGSASCYKEKWRQGMVVAWCEHSIVKETHGGRSILHLLTVKINLHVLSETLSWEINIKKENLSKSWGNTGFEPVTARSQNANANHYTNCPTQRNSEQPVL